MTLAHAQKPLNLEHITSLCGTGTCPTVYKTDRGTLLIQGYAVTGEDAGLDLPTGELLVEIPAHLIEEAARAVASHE